MPIEVDFGTELGTVVFPEDYTQEQVFDFVKQNRSQIRQNLIQRRQQEMADETSQLEAAKYRAGEYGTMETLGGQIAELPKAALSGLGQAAKGFARVFEAGDPFTESTPQEQRQMVARSPITAAGESMISAGEAMPSLPGVQETIPAQISGGIGSTLSVLPGALVAGPVGAGALYGFSAGEAGAEDARRVVNRRIAERLAAGDTQGAQDLQAQASQLESQSFLLNAPIGAVSEGTLGLAGKLRYGKKSIGGVGERLAERLVPKAASVRTQNMIRGGIEGAVTEGLQESLEQTMGNMAAKVTYDPERGVMDGVAQAGFIGAATGGLVGGVVGSERNPNLATANALAEATGADPANPLPRSAATVSGIEDGAQPSGPIEIEPEITPEDVMRMSQEAGIPMPEEVTPAPAPAPVEVASAPAPTPAAVTPIPAPAPAPVDTETGLTPDEQDELDQLITAEDAGLLSEEGAITLAAYRSRLGFPAQTPTPTPSAVQEQGPDEGVLRREEPQPQVEVGLRQVDQGGRPAEVGGAEAEVTPEEVQQVKAEVVPEAPVPAPVPAAIPTPATPAVQSAKLPKDLAGAKPRYNVSMDAYLPTFGSDFDRAAFIVTQKTPSKRDADYLNWAVGVSGMTPEQVRQHGLKVRAQLKQLAAQTKGGTSQKPAALTVPVVAISMPEVKVTAAAAPAPAPAPEPTPEYTPARINKLFRTLKARATAVGKGLYEIKNLTPGQRAVLRTRFGGLQETDQFLLQEKSKVTGYPSDEGFILRDKQEATAGEAIRPAPKPAPIAAKPDHELTEQQYYDARVKEIARDNKITEAEVREQFSREDSNLEHWQAIRNAAESGKQLKVETLNRLPEARIDFLRKQYPQSVPQGYMAPEVRKSVDEKQAEMRAAKRGVRPTPQADPNEKLAAFIEDVDSAITNLESPAKLRAMVKKAVTAGYITARDAAEIASVQKSMGSAEDTTDAFGEFAGSLSMELEKRRKALVAAPAAPAATQPISTAPATEPAPAQVREVKMPPAEKQGTEPLAPKAQKQFLLAQIDEAIAAAPEEATSEKIVISVPGDGEFTLLNYKAALTRFKDLAKKFPVGPLARESKPRTEAKQALKLGALNTKNAVKAASEAVADPTYRPGSPLTAVFSDGKRVVGSNGKILLEVETNAGGTVAKPITVDESGKPVQFETSYPNVDQVIPKTTTVVSRKINTERLFSVLTQAYQAAYDAASKDPDREANAVIVQNRDGSIGLFSEVPGKTSYSHNVRKGAKVLTSYNIRLLTDLVQAMRRVGVSEFDLSVADEKGRSLRTDAGVLTAPGVKGLIMPIRMETYEVPPWAAEPDTGRPDSVESALQKVIAATDPKGKAFEAVAALSNAVVYQASKIALRIYQSTKSWVAARNAGMDYIKSHVQLQNEPETAANFEDHIKAFPNQEIPAGTPERPQPPSPAERVESRGIFRGEVTRDTDENWQAEARKWVDFYKGNLEQAFQGFMGADIDKSLREYVGGELLQRSELEVARAKNQIDLLRALNLQTRIAAALVQAGSDFGKQGRARQLTFARYAWMVPQLVYRRLVNEQQKRKIPFPEITATQVRDWLVESGQQAIDQVKEAMKQADNVFAREFRKIKQVPGEAKGPPIEIKWSEILTKSLQTQGSVRQKMLQVILADPQLRNLSPAGIAEITNLLTTAWENKRNQIFRAEFRKKVPLPNVKPDAREKLFRSLPRILKYANIARATPGEQITTDGPETFLLWEQAFRDAVAPEFGVAEINGLTARKITELAQRAQAAQGTNRNQIIQEMFRLMAREGGVRFSDVLRDYWYAAVLSGTRTQVDNALNILNGALNTLMLAGMSGKEAGLVTKSALKGLDEGIRDFWPMLWRGELYRSVNFNPDQPGNSLEGLGESRNLFAKGLSQAKYVSRLMLALDHVTAMMSDGAAKAYALQKEFTPEVARNLMLPDKKSVQEARDRAIAEGTRPDLVNKRTREILQESFPVDVLMTSKDIREAVTFTEVPQGVMGSLYEGLNAASRKFPALKFLTGTNFVRFAANYTNELLNYAAPIAAYRWYQSAPGKSDQPGGLQYSPARRDLLRAKAAIGTALGATAAALFLGDDDKEEDRDIDITGSFKSLDPNKRKQLLAEGRQPYSIRVGNTYISYRQLGFGGLLGAIGELRDRQLFEPEKWNQEGIIAKVQDAATAGLFIVKDSSAISGLTEFLGFANAYKYDTNEIIEKSAPRYLARLGGSFVPNILKEVDAWSDPSIFKAEPGGLGHEYFLQQVPFARRDIGPGPILNVLGEPVRIERYPYSRWVTQRSEDPAWNTLGQLASRGVFLPVPAITVKVNENGTRREMTREEKYQYQRAVGQGYRKFIEQNSKRLLALPPAEAADFIDKNADRIRRTARMNLKNSF